MFYDDQPRIQELAASGPSYFGAIVLFVVVTIQQPTAQVADLLQDVRRRGEESRALFGSKQRAWEWLHSTRLEGMWRFYKTAFLERPWRSRHLLAREAIGQYLTIPGLGMAKAGFLAQLTLGVGWCADTNNLQHYGIDYRQFDHAKRRPTAARYQLIDRYLRVGEELGGTARLWDRWCRLISERYPTEFPTPQAVSSWHVEMCDQPPF